MGYKLSTTGNFESNSLSELGDRTVHIFNRDQEKLESYLLHIENSYKTNSNIINGKENINSNNSIVSEEIYTSTTKNTTSNTSKINTKKNNKYVKTENRSTFSKGEGKIKKYDIQKFRSRGKSIRRRTSKRLSLESKSIKVRKKFKNKSNFNVSIPSIYDSSYSELCSSFSDDIPLFVNTPSIDDVKIASETSFRSYTSSGRQLSSNLQYFLFGSIVSAFDVLGIPWKVKKQGDIKPISIRESVKNLAKNTNSGFPYFKKKINPDVVKNTIFWVNQFLRNPTFYSMGKQFIKPNNLFLNFQSKGTVFPHINENYHYSELGDQPTHIMYRFQISPYIDKTSRVFETKIRPVWCVPYNIVSLEYMFFQPMLDSVKRNSMKEESPVFPYGYSNKQLSERIASPLQHKILNSRSKQLRSFDYSKFDRDELDFITSAIFSIWATNLDMSSNRWKAYNALRFYTMHTPFIYDKSIYVTRKGICSGSYTTNIRGTITNLALVICALRIKNNNEKIARSILNKRIKYLESIPYDFRNELIHNLYIVDVKCCHVYGDDGVILEDDEFFLLHKFICGDLGWTVTYDEPVKPGESFYFLGRFWDKDGFPWHTRYYMMAHIMFRSKWYNKNETNFDISEYLELYRILSICLPLRDGKDFLYDAFYHWKPFRDFINGDKGYYLLKEWPHNEYQYIPRSDAFDIFYY